jgi:ABC-type arginine transport system ATPase subunit
VALVPEGRRTFPSLTVAENLLVGAYRAGTGPWDPTAVYQLFPLVGQRRTARGGNLSGGEQQALAIGRALMGNPRLLLLDEVSLGLAPVVVARLYEALPEIAARGTTLLLVILGTVGITMALLVPRGLWGARPATAGCSSSRSATGYGRTVWAGAAIPAACKTSNHERPS